MQKLFLLALISLSVAFACHFTCDGNCAADTYTCTGCIANASLLSHSRACACDEGYYLSSSTHACVQVEAAEGDVDVFTDCERNIAEQAVNLKFTITCTNDQDVNGKNLVKSNFNLNFENTAIRDECEAELKLRAFYFTDYQAEDKDDSKKVYLDAGNPYITYTSTNEVTFTFPLIDMYTLAQITSNNENGAIIQNLKVGLLLGHQRKYVAQHTWNVEVYTNREEVNVVTLNVSKRYTSGCKQGEECIVIQDLDTNAIICSDDTCEFEQLSDKTYQVGDLLYIKISFVDASYLKWLKLKNFFYITPDRIFKFTSDVTPTYEPGYTILKYTLLEPQIAAKIQINSLIVTSKPSRRVLADAESTEIQSTFTLDVVGSSDDASSAFALIFGALNLLAILLL